MALQGSAPAPRGLTDTHCHLNHELFAGDRAETIARARAIGIERLLVIGYDLASSRFACELASAHADIQAVIGIHPESAAEWSDGARRELLDLRGLYSGKIAAWGEIGLDYHWESISREEQRRVFKAQLDCAAACGIPAVIHCRDAYDDVLDCLESKAFGSAVLHCFTGTLAQAQRAVSMGLYLGIGGIATFKKSIDLRSVYSDETIPFSKLLLETDAPYLAPQPWRGKRNEPEYLVAVADMLAELHGCTSKEVAEQTSSNADQLFGRMRHENFVDR